jgi:hypothetical protein
VAVIAVVVATTVVVAIIAGVKERMDDCMRKERKRWVLWAVTVTVCFLCGQKEVSAQSGWKDSYEQMRVEVEQNAQTVLEKEIADKDRTDVDDEDKGIILTSYDIKNAIPVWSLKCDATMLADYKAQNNDFSKIIQWENKWYVPAVTMSGSQASIFLQKEDGEYKVYGTFFDEDEIYIADTMDEIKLIVDKKVGKNAVSVKIISIPFYNMNLLYVQDSSGKEFVIPYEAVGANVLENIDEQAGKVYSITDFIADMERSYDEYTIDEMKEISAQKTLGGGIQPKLKPVRDRELKKEWFPTMTVVGIAGAFVIFVVPVFVRLFILRKKNFT